MTKRKPIDIAAGLRRVMKRFPIIMAALAASGCVTTRYVTVPCLTPQQYDELAEAMPPKIRAQLTGQADQDARILAGSAVRLRGYSEGLLSVLKGCVG